MTIVISAMALILATCIFVRNFLEYKECKDSTMKLTKYVIKENNKTNIDWQQLEKINKDIIGWIRVEHTNINYPILKDNSNLKYLKHSFDGKSNRNGSIFTLDDNPLQNEETTIYGHNMQNEIMFSELAKYMNEDFFKEHASFEISTKNQNYKAIIFSCYSIDESQEEENIKSLDFAQEVDYYKKASKYPVENIDNIKKIVKLSTCSYINAKTHPTNQRHYIIASIIPVE